MLARRLLLGASGARSFAGRIPEQGRWVRNAGNPIFVDPTAVNDAAQEVSIFYESGTWKMWYRGGWHTAGETGMGYATSTDGIAWTRYVGNPVLGAGGSGEDGNVVQPCVLKIDGTWWCYYNLYPSQAKYAATSADGLSWTLAAVTITLPTGMTAWGNVYAWKEGATWYGFFDAGATGTYWRAYLFTSSDGLTWTIANGGNALSSLQIASGSMYGNCAMPTPNKVNGRYQMWYHAAPAGATLNGNLPTDIYHASSDDLVSWNVITPNPILTHLGGATFEKEQCADAKVIEVGGLSYLYYSGVDDTGGYASVGLAQFAGTLQQIVSGT
jgi:sucrose-6-phosphate hydrolase SacC (GH32 family)